MVQLHLISNKNLISALHYGIDLHIEEPWDALVEAKNSTSGQTVGATITNDLTASLQRNLVDIILHLWPDPLDPVIVELVALSKQLFAKI